MAAPDSRPFGAPVPSQRVLPTLNADGSRYRIRPRLYDGRLLHARRVVAYALVVLFVGLPFVKMHDKPVILLDVMRREFTLFGRTFLATDGVLLMFLLLAIFMAIMLITAVVGRAWCGWACPQTVYMEFLFRPIERLFEGGRAEQLRLDKRGGGLRRLAKNAVFLLSAALVGNVFLAYFVGVDALRDWVRHSPLERPTPFLVMAVTAGLVFFDFAYFREQMCTVICPYARLQSVLLDRRSLIVGYDTRRGEPRGKGKPKPGDGDCIDCKACVVACPTGIDIRAGLQLECIACAQCIDACDSIMDRIKKPRGLIRYDSQETLERGGARKIVRPRVIIYAVLLGIALVALTTAGAERRDAEVIVLRGLGAPFTEQGDLVTNQIRIKVRNRDEHEHRYRIELLDAPEAQLIAPENPLVVAPGKQRSTSVFVRVDRSAMPTEERHIRFYVADGEDFERTLPYKLLGPAPEAP